MTAIESMNDCIRLWDWCALTGRRKSDWPEWEHNGGTVPYARSDCPLCEYSLTEHGAVDCPRCPMYGHWGIGAKRNRCDTGLTLYTAWVHILPQWPSESKAAAAALVAKLREVRAGMDNERD